jgi:hypothetical protein
VESPRRFFVRGLSEVNPSLKSIIYFTNFYEKYMGALAQGIYLEQERGELFFL